MPKLRIDRAPGSIPGTITSYNGLPTAGEGVSPTRAFGTLAGNSADGTTITSYTSATGGLFEVGGWFRVTAWTSGAVAMQVSYTDANGGVITNVKLFGHNLTAGTWINSISSTGPFQLASQCVTLQPGATITLKTSFGGAATGTFYAFIRKVG